MTEGPYPLPEGWRWDKLCKTCEIWDRLRVPIKKKERKMGKIPYCGANGIIDYVDGFTHDGEFVMLAEDGGNYGPGEDSAYLMRGRFWANNHVHILCGKKDVLVNRFLLYCLNAADLQNFLTGATRPKLTQKALRSIPIPLPPLSEQRRIVAKVEALMERVREAKRRREEARQDAEKLMQTALAEVFPKPEGELPADWLLKKVNEVSERLQYGYTQSAKQEPVGPRFLRITDIQNGSVNWDLVPYCECDEIVLNKYRLKNGEILFARSGATTGKTYLVQNCPEAVFASYLIRLRLKSGIFPDYVYWYFQSPYYWNQITLRGAAQPNMNAQILGNLEVPIPTSESEQRHIVSYLNEIYEQVTSLKQAQEQTEKEFTHLEQSILDRAFRGEL